MIRAWRRFVGRGEAGWSDGLVVAVVLLAVLALYLPTLQTDVSGNHAEPTLDTGEFQIALNVWGTMHPTGYPLYGLVGSGFVHLARLLGAGPATAASLFSLLWSLGVVVLVALVVRELGGNAAYGAVAGLALATTRSFWVHGVVAEVYALGVFLVAATLWLSLRADRLPWLGVAFGLAVGHHRAAALALPGALLALLVRGAPWKVSWREMAGAVLAGAATLGVYLYLPVRAWQGAPWVYGRPDTWEGLVAIVLAREYAHLMVPQTTPAALGHGLLGAVRVLVEESTPVFLGAGAAGLALWLAVRREAAVLGPAAVAGAFLGFAAVFPRAVYLPALLLPVLVMAAVGIGLLLSALAGLHRHLAWVAVLGTLALAATTAAHAWPRVVEFSRDTTGRELIENVREVDEPSPVLVAPWGTDYFALAYGRLVTGEIAHARLVTPDDPEARGALERGGGLYLPKDLFHVFPLDRWEERWGRLCLSAAGWRLVHARSAPCDGPAPAREPIAMMGEEVALLDARATADARGRTVHLSLRWRAVRRPSADYSVFVHLTDQPAVDGPEDIVAQGDSVHPVFGWYPTSRWTPGEVVREEYRVSWPPERAPTRVVVGMYRRDPATGAFQNLGSYVLPIDAEGG